MYPVYLRIAPEASDAFDITTNTCSRVGFDSCEQSTIRIHTDCSMHVPLMMYMNYQ